MSSRLLMSYTHDFLVAADAHATAATQKGVDGEVDGMMCVIALQNAVVGATRLLGRDHLEVRACLAAAGDLKDVRDMLTHFDDYAIGSGRLQRSSGDTSGPYGWMPMWNYPESIAILNRRQGEKEATSYEVSLHEALRAVAGLVGAAGASMGFGPSQVVERLTAGA